MNILVTGTTGYIGYEFVKAYGDKYNIMALAREKSDTSQLEKLQCSIFKYKDFNDIEKFFELNNITGIVHFASNVVVEHKTKDIDTILDSNIKFGIYLLDCSKTYNIKWFINTGTFWQNYQSIDYNPVNFYAATKEAFEVIAKYYTQTSDLIFTTIKLNDTFGPNDTRVKIFSLWEKYSGTDEILDMSKGEQVIDISYIEDVINAFDTMINNLQLEDKEKYNNKAYVVTSNQRMSLKELAELFKKVTKKSLNINWGARAYRDREVMVPYVSEDVVPNWKQKYTLEEAIIKMIGE